MKNRENHIVKIANEIRKNFLEVILAKGFDKESLKILRSKKNLRIIDISNFKMENLTSIKEMMNLIPGTK